MRNITVNFLQRIICNLTNLFNERGLKITMIQHWSTVMFPFITQNEAISERNYADNKVFMLGTPILSTDSLHVERR